MTIWLATGGTAHHHRADARKAARKALALLLGRPPHEVEVDAAVVACGDTESTVAMPGAPGLTQEVA